MTSWGVTSEIGRLRVVLVHQPGSEHRKTLPWNKDVLLFDNILDFEEARPEHKGFSTVLSNHGVEVLFLADLLKHICADRAEREEVFAEVLGPDVLSNLRGQDLHPYHLSRVETGRGESPGLVSPSR